MTTNTSPNLTLESPPSSDGRKNLIASQKGVMYLNKPRNYKEEDSSEVAENPIADTSQPGSNTPSESTHDWQKRYSDLKSYHDKQIKAKEAELTEKARLLTEKEQALRTLQEAPVKLPKTPAEIAAFKEKYPDLYMVMETIALEKDLNTQTKLDKALKENEERTNALAAEKAREELLKLHPDAMTLKTDPDFLNWYEEQITQIRALIESPSVIDVARGLDIYKKDKGLITKTKKQKEDDNKAASKTVTTQPRVEVGVGGGKIWKASEVKAIPMSQYHKYESDIQSALMEGRYDPDN